MLPVILQTGTSEAGRWVIVKFLHIRARGRFNLIFREHQICGQKKMSREKQLKCI